MSDTSLLFEDDHIQVLSRGGVRAFSLVTFADLTVRPGEGRFYGREVAEKLGIPAVGFVARRENWYPHASVEAAIPAVRAVLRKRAIGYGYSMGAYGALKHGRRLGLDATLAVAPQVTIDPRDPPHDRRYAEFFRPALHEGMRIGAADLTPLVSLLADPYDPVDGAHARIVAGLSGATSEVRWLRAPHTGHAAIWLLASSDMLLRALRLTLDGRFDDFAQVLRRTRKRSPHWNRLMARAATRYGHGALAERLWKRAARLGLSPAILESQRAEGFEERALRLRKLRRKPEAVAAMRQAGLLLQANPEQCARIGHALVSLRDWAGAEAQFRAAIAGRPGMADAHLGLSLALGALGRQREALDAAREGHALVPAHPALAAHLGQLLVGARRLDEAEAVLRATLAARPAEGPLLLALSHARFARGDGTEAIGLAAEAEAAQPGRPEGALWLGQLLLGAGRAAEAEAVYRRALLFAPKEGAAHLGLVQALKAQGRTEEARAAAEEGVRRAPGHVALAAAHAQADPVGASARWLGLAARALGFRRAAP